jgi:Flp pilus assembly protein TadD
MSPCSLSAANRHRKSLLRCSGLVCVLLLLISFTGLSLAQNEGKTVRRHRVAEDASYGPALAKAEAAIQAKQYDVAEQELLKLAAAQAENYRVWFDLGLVYSETGRNQQAIDAYRKAVAADPKIFESQLNLGLLLARAGDPEAETHLRAATQLQPASQSSPAQSKEVMATAWLALAHVLENSNPQEAMRAYQRASSLRPADPVPHLAAAALAEQLRNWTVAEDEYRAAHTADASSHDAIAGLVNVYLNTRQYAKAEPLLRGLVSEKPQDSSLRLLLGRLLAAQGRTEEALKEFEAGAQGSQDPKTRRDLAQLYLEAKQYGKAAEQFRVLLQQNPNDGELRAALGSALLHQHQFQQAQAELVAALKLKPDMVRAYTDLAMAASENKNYVLAIQALDARARLQPDEPGTYFLRALAYDHLKDYQHAAENYRRFLEVAGEKFPDQEWQARHRLKAIDPRNSP